MNQSELKFDPKENQVCPRCGKTGYAFNEGHLTCTKRKGDKSPQGPLPMIDHDAGWPYTDPNIPCDV